MKPLIKAGKFKEAKAIAQRRFDRLSEAGRTPDQLADTQEMIDALGSNDPSQILQLQTIGNSAVDFAERTGIISVDSKGKIVERFSPTTERLPGGISVQTTSTGRKLVTDGAGNVIEGQAAIEAIETAESRGIDIQQARSGARALGKGGAERIETAINEGVDAAQGIAILKRSLTLLDEVKTGGIQSAILKGKQLFGVEGANEAELSANLGKAVLGQLKTVFGAQFTEKEGSRLERIEAGFGKSTKGNRRLLEQTLTLADRAAKRGIKAAVDREDFRAAQDIKELMDFDLDDESISNQFSPPAAETQVAPSSIGRFQIEVE